MTRLRRPAPGPAPRVPRPTARVAASTAPDPAVAPTAEDPLRDGTAPLVPDPEDDGTVVYGLPGALGARYEPLRVLGSGGQGWAQLCRGRADGVLVVVKQYWRFRRPGEQDPREAWRTVDPAHVAPFVGPGFGSDPSTGFLWEVLEYCPYGTITEYAQAYGGGRLPAAAVEPVIRQLTEAIDALHHHGDNGVVHRDITPRNVLVRSLEPFDVVLTDLGHSVSRNGEVTEYGTIAWTPFYASPDSTTGIVHPASDWWGLGMILAELLPGVHPYADAHGDLPDPHRHPQLVQMPVPLDRVRDTRHRLLLRGLLALDRHDRWGATEVREWLAGGSPAVPDEDGSGPSVFRAEAFRGEFRTPQQLAGAMAADWDAARRLVKGRDLLELDLWLREHHPQRSITTIVADRRERSSPYRKVDRAVAEVLVRLDPQCRPRYEGWALRTPDLRRLAARAASADAADARRAVLTLYSSHALLAFQGHATQRELAEVDHRWHRMVGQATRWFAAVPEAGPVPDAIEVLLLDAALGAPGPLSRSRPSGERRRARWVPWYADLLGGAGDAEGIDAELRTLLLGLVRPAAGRIAGEEQRRSALLAREEHERRRTERRERAAAAAERRRPLDTAVLWTAVVLIGTGVVPATIGAVLRARGTSIPSELIDLDDADLRLLHLRHLFVYTVGDIAAGAAVVLVLASVVVLVGRWRFRPGRVLAAGVALLLGIVGGVPAAEAGWAAGDRALVTAVQISSYPAETACGTRSAMTRAAGDAALIQFTVLRSSTTGLCSRIEVRSGWTLVGSRTLPEHVRIKSRALTEAFLALRGPTVDTTYGIVATSAGRLTGVRASAPGRWWDVGLRRADRVFLIGGEGQVLVLLQSRDRMVGEIRSAATGRRTAVLCRGRTVAGASFDRAASRFRWHCGALGAAHADSGS